MPYLRLSLWTLFFATTAYGHVALKVAMGQNGGSFLGRLLSAWGVTALVAWGISALAWAALLQEERLGWANAVSLLRYPLIALAAVLLLREEFELHEWIGSSIMLVGLYVLLRS